MTIRDLRERSGLNRTDFCNKFHIVKGTLIHWEHGDRRPPEHVLYLIQMILDKEELLSKVKSDLEEELKKEHTDIYTPTFEKALRQTITHTLDIIEKEEYAYENDYQKKTV